MDRALVPEGFPEILEVPLTEDHRSCLGIVLANISLQHLSQCHAIVWRPVTFSFFFGEPTEVLSELLLGPGLSCGASQPPSHIATGA